MSSNIMRYLMGSGRLQFMDIIDLLGPSQKEYLNKVENATLIVPTSSEINSPGFDIKNYLLRGIFTSANNFPDNVATMGSKTYLKKNVSNDTITFTDGTTIKAIPGEPVFQMVSNQRAISGGGPMRIKFNMEKYHQDVQDDFKKYIEGKSMDEIVNPYLVASMSFLAWAKMSGQLAQFSELISYNPIDTFYITIAPQATGSRPVPIDIINRWYSETLGLYISRSGNTYEDYVSLIQEVASPEGKFNPNGNININSVSRESIIEKYGGNIKKLLMDEIRFIIYRETLEFMTGGYKGLMAVNDLFHNIYIYDDFSTLKSSLLFDLEMPEPKFPDKISAIIPFARSDFCMFSLRRRESLRPGRANFDSKNFLEGGMIDASGELYHWFSTTYNHQQFSHSILDNLNRMSV